MISNLDADLDRVNVQVLRIFINNQQIIYAADIKFARQWNSLDTLMSLLLLIAIDLISILIGDCIGLVFGSELIGLVLGVLIPIVLACIISCIHYMMKVPVTKAEEIQQNVLNPLS